MSKNEFRCSRLLADAPYKLLSIEPQTLEDVRESLELVGANLGCERQAIDEALQRFDSKRSEIRARIDASLRAGSRKRPKVALLEWFDPLFYGGHWIKEMVVDAGGTYELCEKGQRSKVMTQDDLLDYDPDVIILAPCGFGIERCVKDAKTILYKGEHFKVSQTWELSFCFFCFVSPSNSLSFSSPRLLTHSYDSLCVCVCLCVSCSFFLACFRH